MDIRSAIVEHVSRNWEAYTGGAGVLGLAIVSTIPENRPKTLDEWWTWMRSALQTASPTRHGPSTPPLLPENPTKDNPQQPALPGK